MYCTVLSICSSPTRVLSLRDRYRPRTPSLDVVVVKLYTAGTEYGRYKEHVSDSGFRRFSSPVLARSLTYSSINRALSVFFIFSSLQAWWTGSKGVNVRS